MNTRIFEDRTISLLTMQQFYASRFIAIFRLLEHIRESIEDVPGIHHFAATENQISSMRLMYTECTAMNLTQSAVLANRVLHHFEHGEGIGHQLTMGELRIQIEKLNERITDELNSVILFRFEPHEVAYLSDPLPKWAKVEKIFTHAVTDIYEAAKCFAAMRYPGCVFHCMRVAEIGLRSICDDLNITIKKNPAWNDIINAIAEHFREKHKSKHGGNADGWKKEEPFYSEVLASVTAMKDSWRNKVMHVNELGVDLFYQPDTAKRIYDATRNFMEVLSAKPIRA